MADGATPSSRLPGSYPSDIDGELVHPLTSATAAATTPTAARANEPHHELPRRGAGAEWFARCTSQVAKIDVDGLSARSRGASCRAASASSRRSWPTPTSRAGRRRRRARDGRSRLPILSAFCTTSGELLWRASGRLHDGRERSSRSFTRPPSPRSGTVQPQRRRERREGGRRRRRRRRRGRRRRPRAHAPRGTPRARTFVGASQFSVQFPPVAQPGRLGKTALKDRSGWSSGGTRSPFAPACPPSRRRSWRPARVPRRGGARRGTTPGR